MNKFKFKYRSLYRFLPHIILFAAILLIILSIFSNSWQEDARQVAETTEQHVAERIKELEKHIDKSIKSPDDYYSVLHSLPEDLVIYVYENDSLKFWGNQFPLLNDNIEQKVVFQRLTNLRDRLHSPLTQVSEEYSFMNLGPKWYVIKKVIGENNLLIIAGLEVQNTIIRDLSRNDNGVNPHLKLPTNFATHPLSTSGGEEIKVHGAPIFKILYERSDSVPFFSNSMLRWMSLGLFCIAIMLILGQNRKIKYYIGSIVALSLTLGIAFYWSAQMHHNTEIFSPTTYADGSLFLSLGSLILLNTFITLCCIATYMIRKRIFNLILSCKRFKKYALIIYGLIIIALIILLLIYVQTTLRSLLLNSNISLELYRWNIDIPKTILVYFSYIALLFCTLLLLQMAGQLLWTLFGFRYNALSRKSILLFSLCTTAYFCIISGIIGFQRETERIEIWANRLAVNRDLDLEIRLMSVEEGIATDTDIAALSKTEESEEHILNILSEAHLSRFSQNYGVDAQILDETDPEAVRHYNQLLMSCEPISEGSRFLFYYDALGNCKYLGLFLFPSGEMNYKTLIVEIDPELTNDHRGYHSILGQFSSTGKIDIPPFFSYAKYTDDKLVSYKGHYPYPTTLDASVKNSLKNTNVHVIRIDEHTHFLHKISDSEIILISRPTRSTLVFFTSFSYLFLIMFGVLQIFVRQKHKKQFRSNFFRTRINTILFVSSTLILASLTVVSIYFVYKRNEENMHTMMSSRISTIQALINTHTQDAQTHMDLTSKEFHSQMENISNITKSDISLYTTDGQIFYSSEPEVFHKMLVGTRINQEAFYNIKNQHQRLFINPEKVGEVNYWGLYAPILNGKREIIAIAASPYTEEDVNFRMEALFHAALLINLFLLLLIISLVFSTREVDSMFAPLLEIGKKMKKIDIHNMEQIVYNRQDEISSLVDAYNRMVKELSDSTTRLAQVERDKAWSQMARQVAHEIKNPLTPIKLEIQRLIRLKENNNPKWEEKFDSVSAVILEHIDILTDTANEFSTFAKLYTEEPVSVDLEKIIKEQIMIFNNKDNISIEYIGLENAMVMVPKPQFIRVLVNLITNALQAVEIRQKEEAENEEQITEGKVLICLRNGAKDNYYDIVIDDNGHGVSDVNQSKLFTPNFTTKNGGTGLGLAICRNIIEKCDGEIGYRKSYSLGGASFYISIPKHKKEA